MTLPQLHQRRADLLAYLRSCVEAGDWHGVRDAAADLEVCEAMIEERGKTPSQRMAEAGFKRRPSRRALPDDLDPKVFHTGPVCPHGKPYDKDFACVECLGH